MAGFTELLSEFRANAQTERGKGTDFESATRTLISFDPEFKAKYRSVMTFVQFAKQNRLDGRDRGIDLIALDHSGYPTAIQCKFYDPSTRLQKSDIDSFLAESGKSLYAARILVTTAPLSESAERAVENQPNFSIITTEVFASSSIDWAAFMRGESQPAADKKSLRPHQQSAVEKVLAGLSASDRGKMIMACGTGKTFTALKIAEAMAAESGTVLFLVPSLSLLQQSLIEWTHNSSRELVAFSVCSDSAIGHVKDDSSITDRHLLHCPATTDAETLSRAIHGLPDDGRLRVIFSTYHSIEVVSEAQKQLGSKLDFDLIICDEAHRTTGATYAKLHEDESAFTRVHQDEFIRGRKRLYMTATPRIYSDNDKSRAEDQELILCSMDDEALYGKAFYTLPFSRAVKDGLLVDYKVLILQISQSEINIPLQSLAKESADFFKVQDAARIIGCWKGLSKYQQQGTLDQESPMRRAVAFCQVIDKEYRGNKHKVSSKLVADIFAKVVHAYKDYMRSPESGFDDGEADLLLDCAADHIDGRMDANQKLEKLRWLKSEPPPNSCHILSNVRCLTEGVDVPALDAILFMTPRQSEMDVVQAVGRVMRNSPGKKLGYVILPVVIDEQTDAEAALNSNEAYRVVWRVLNALRAHDDRFDGMINRINLGEYDYDRMEIITTGILPKKQISEDTGLSKSKGEAPGSDGSGTSLTVMGDPDPLHSDDDAQLSLGITPEITAIEKAIYAKIVKKVGTRGYWKQWSAEIGKISGTLVGRITAIIHNPANHDERAAFQALLNHLQGEINPSVTETETIEMLAQHIVTKPVFDALFKDYQFAQHNPVSMVMQRVLDQLLAHQLESETDNQKQMYEWIRSRVDATKTDAARQTIVKDLYGSFFKAAFPKLADRLGIVYTPIEIIDFILHSVAEVVQSEFGLSLGSKGVHIIDPFTGTGQFITRLIQGGFINDADLAYKFKHEIHANEILLLPYYLAAINIESAYHARMGGNYQPFEGICLTDSFQLTEPRNGFFDHPINGPRLEKQLAAEFKVIIGNPPYSALQKSENDNAKNIDYHHLDDNIKKTFVANSQAQLKGKLYDSYIRAIRWAADRISNAGGVIGFITGSAWIERGFADGMRKCLKEEMASLHIFHLRDDLRKNMMSKSKAGEGENIFNIMTGVAISILVKNPMAQNQGQIYFHDIGDNLTKLEKVKRVIDYRSIAGITAAAGWTMIQPDQHNDWLSQRLSGFDQFVKIGDKDDESQTVIFENYSMGVVTARDAWCYNYSNVKLSSNIKKMIDFYNAEVNRYRTAKKSNPSINIDDFVNDDSTKISWTRALKKDLSRDKPLSIRDGQWMNSSYRPFTRNWFHYSRRLNECVYQMPEIFPNDSVENLVISVAAVGNRSGFSVLMTNRIADLHFNGDTQCFPLYLFEPLTEDSVQGDLGLVS
ncbi:MAG: DEAD/DEAH box helicase family protein, partial [Alphaproteobacteria bacterium]|nr:DEAD/DEAH box helicase family protein [Alphaproteobacteria bacterium]